MDAEEKLKISDDMLKMYSNFLNRSDDIISLNQAEYYHLLKMLLYEIDGNKKNIYNPEPVYAGFAKENVSKLADYLAWITFLNTNKNFVADCQITIPQNIAKELFLHLLAYDTENVYVI